MLELFEALNHKPLDYGHIDALKDERIPKEAEYYIRTTAAVYDLFNSHRSYVGVWEVMTFSKIDFADRLRELEARFKK
jgi:hypothetical protein